jgi:hypothetical protein
MHLQMNEELRRAIGSLNVRGTAAARVAVECLETRRFLSAAGVISDSGEADDVGEKAHVEHAKGSHHDQNESDSSGSEDQTTESGKDDEVTESKGVDEKNEKEDDKGGQNDDSGGSTGSTGAVTSSVTKKRTSSASTATLTSLGRPTKARHHARPGKHGGQSRVALTPV